MFDTDKNHSVDALELISAISLLRHGTATEKLKFLFDVYDESGKIDLPFIWIVRSLSLDDGEFGAWHLCHLWMCLHIRCLRDGCHALGRVRSTFYNTRCSHELRVIHKHMVMIKSKSYNTVGYRTLYTTFFQDWYFNETMKGYATNIR